MQPWFTVYFFDIGHPCCDQLTPVNIKCSLASIKFPYHGFKVSAYWGHVCFLTLTADQVLVNDWIAGSCEVNMLKTVLRCSKPVHANPGLKVNRVIIFSSMQMFFAAFFGIIQAIFRNNIQKTSHRKVQNSNENSTFSWVSLIGLWTT